MRRLVSTVTLVAFLGLGVAGWRASAQEVSPETSQRLREAVERLREGEEGVAVPVQMPLSEAELDALVAPVALYPDALLAQVLVAATYPLQIAQADQLITASDEMSDQELADALAAEEWDPSVLVLLSGFPTVITRMAEDSSMRPSGWAPRWSPRTRMCWRPCSGCGPTPRRRAICQVTRRRP